jgi:cytidine deaminase
MDHAQLIALARSVVRPRRIAEHTSGDVGCALLAADGKVYLGVCIDVSCGIGFCAEHSAIAAMVTAGEQRIVQIVAVRGNGEVLPPCGRCREFMYQLDGQNIDAEVLIAADRSKTLAELLPHPW